MREHYLSLNQEEETVISKKIKASIVVDDEDEKQYYLMTIDSINKIPKERMPIWNYWVQHYSHIDWDLLAEQPYFGSVLVAGQARVYIGKQRYDNISEGKSYVTDWRSNFGNLFYLRKKKAFIEHRFVEVSDIREYMHKYMYVDLLNSEYDDFFMQTLTSKKAGFLQDVVSTIDKTQNSIIRSESKPVELIFGGPGTGKTTIGLHILSFKTYHYVKKNKEYPSILILVTSELMKHYIASSLKSLDLIGKSYHNTILLTISEALKNITSKFQYVFIDEAQDVTHSFMDSIMAKTDSDQTILCIDDNQRLENESIQSHKEYFKRNSIEFCTHYLNVNYRNPSKIVNIANRILNVSQSSYINKSCEVNYSVWNEQLNPESFIIKFLNAFSSESTAIIVFDKESKEFIVNVLSSNEIHYRELNVHSIYSSNVVICSEIEARGLEFDQIIIVGLRIHEHNLMMNRRLYVSITRSMGNVMIISPFIPDTIEFDNYLINSIDPIQDSYSLFRNNNIKLSIFLMRDISIDELLVRLKQSDFDCRFEYLIFALDSFFHCCVIENANMCNLLALAEAKDLIILSELLIKGYIKYKTLFNKKVINNPLIHGFLVSRIDQIILVLRKEFFMYLDCFSLELVMNSLSRGPNKVIELFAENVTFKKWILKNEPTENILLTAITQNLLSYDDILIEYLSGREHLRLFISTNMNGFVTGISNKILIHLFEHFDHRAILLSMRCSGIPHVYQDKIETLVLSGNYKNDYEVLRNGFQLGIVKDSSLFNNMSHSYPDLIALFGEDLIDKIYNEIINGNDRLSYAVFQRNDYFDKMRAHIRHNRSFFSWLKFRSKIKKAVKRLHEYKE